MSDDIYAKKEVVNEQLDALRYSMQCQLDELSEALHRERQANLRLHSRVDTLESEVDCLNNELKEHYQAIVSLSK